MTYNGGKRFTFKKSGSKSKEKQSFQSSFIDSKVSVPYPSNSYKKFESPSKKLKFCSSSGHAEKLDDFGEGMDDWNIDDDDFAKDLTVDELNMLEVEAVKQTEKKDLGMAEYQTTHKSKIPSEKILDSRVLSPKSPYNHHYPEKTLDLYTKTTAFGASASSREQKFESFSDAKVKMLETKLDEYERKAKAIEDAALAKDGEVKMLRQKLNSLQEEKSNLMIQMQLIEGGASAKQSENEKQLERENKRLQTQLQFKDKEILEAKEWKLKYEKIKADLSSPTVSSSKKMKNSPSVEKTSAAINTVFMKNSFESPRKKLKILNGKEEVKERCACSRDCTKTDSKLINGSKWADNVEKETYLLEKVLVENAASEEKLLDIDISYVTETGESFSAIAYRLICECVSRLRGRKRQNIISILEFVERHIDVIDCSQKEPKQEVDLVCNEAVPSTSENEDKKDNSEFTYSNILFTLAGLLVLHIIVKHCSFVQDVFLKAINKDCSVSQNDTSKEHTSKEPVKQGYILTELDLPHILLRKDDYLRKPESMDSSEEQSTKSVASGTVNQLDYEPDDLVGKLFKILTSEKSCKEMKESVFEILVCLSSCCSSVSKAGLVEKFIEFKLLSLLVNIFEFNKLSSLLLIIKNLSIETGFQNILCYCPDICPFRVLYKALLVQYDGWEVADGVQIKLEVYYSIIILAFILCRYTVTS